MKINSHWLHPMFHYTQSVLIVIYRNKSVLLQIFQSEVVLFSPCLFIFSIFFVYFLTHIVSKDPNNNIKSITTLDTITTTKFLINKHYYGQWQTQDFLRRGTNGNFPTIFIIFFFRINSNSSLLFLNRLL